MIHSSIGLKGFSFVSTTADAHEDAVFHSEYYLYFSICMIDVGSYFPSSSMNVKYYAIKFIWESEIVLKFREASTFNN